jgi:uncharacterized metal-binding protein YceD (DUF177 family)
MNDGFIIPLNGLTTGQHEFDWAVGKEFFEGFDNSEILDAELDAFVRVEKSGRYLGIDCEVTGDVTVECDRCLDEVHMPIDVEIRLSVKYGDEESSDEHHEGEREVIFIPETDAEFDMSQIIYDYVCLALPMQRVHEDGECNPEAMKYYGCPIEIEVSEDEDAANPFATLKDLFK